MGAFGVGKLIPTEVAGNTAILSWYKSVASVTDFLLECSGGLTSGDKICTESTLGNFDAPTCFLFLVGLSGGAVCKMCEMTASREVVGPDATPTEMAGAG